MIKSKKVLVVVILIIFLQLVYLVSKDAANQMAGFGLGLNSDSLAHDRNARRGYELRLYGMPVDTYETEWDGVVYSVESFNTSEIRMTITNQTNETKTIGGSYGLQRKKKNIYVDVDPNRGHKVSAGENTITLYEVKEEDNIEVYTDTAESTFRLRAGRSVEATFSTALYDIELCEDSEGYYRVIYGDAKIYFPVAYAYLYPD